MTRYSVLMTADAAQDLEDLHTYLTQYDSAASAEYVLGGIEDVFGSLAATPERGGYPKELLALGIREYRELFFKPYRILYRVLEKRVYVQVIADGRRDMQSLLQRRLLQ